MRHRYGISLGVSPREPLSRTAELARAIDDRGFEALWYIDFQLGMKDMYAAMNLTALSTKNVLIGAGITNLVTRHPTVTANATAAFDELSNGRAVLGLGAGWSAVLGAGGTPSRLGALRSGIDEFRQLFSGEPCDLYGNQVRLATAKRQIPVYLAVSQPAMLRLAGETCDGAVLMGAADPEFCSWQLDYIHQGLETAGRDRGELTVDLFVTMSVGDDTERALDDVRAWATSQAATFHPWKQMPPAWERSRGEFARAAGAYGLVDHLSLQAEHKHTVSDTSRCRPSTSTPCPTPLAAGRAQAHRVRHLSLQAEHKHTVSDTSRCRPSTSTPCPTPLAAGRAQAHRVRHLSLQAEHKHTVSDDFVKSVALVGDLDTCVDRLRRLWQIDIDRITFALLSGGREQRLAQLADTVIGAVEAEGGS